MKKQFKHLFLLLLLPFLVFSNGGKFTHNKQKNVKITYLVNSDASIDITNSYGNITVITWDENKIDLDVTIKVSGNNENWVNQRLGDINIDINALKSIVSAKTVIGNSNSKSNGSNNNFEINYILKIPKNSATVTLNNKYGNIYTADLSSNTNLFCKYGMLDLGKLNSSRNNIQMEYCNNSNITYLNSGLIIAKYSDLKIEQLTKLELNSDYTDIDIQEAKEVKYTSKYGSIEIQKIQNLEGLGNYLNIKVGNLNGNLNLNTKYSAIAISNVNAKAAVLEIASSYTNTKIQFDENYTFNFDITVRYASFKYENDFSFTNKEETNTTKKYSGYYMKKGTNVLKINSDYGNITLIKK